MSWLIEAKPGDMVVCINDTPKLSMIFNGRMDGLTKGTIYTIRRIGLQQAPHVRGSLGIWLEEIHRPLAEKDVYEVGYDPSRFRPVSKLGTDKGMKIFRKILETKVEEINVM